MLSSSVRNPGSKCCPKLTCLVTNKQASTQLLLTSASAYRPLHTGQDGSMAEYNLDKLSTAHGLHTSSLHPLAGPGGQAGGPRPTALAFAPPLPYFAHSSADTLLLVADDAHKLRLYDADTHTCVATAVGPLHGGPVTSCRVFRYNPLG